MNTIKPSLLLIYTGGTIGMVKDSVNGSLSPLPFNHIMDEIPEINRANCTLSSYTFDPPLDSSNVNSEQWVKMASIISDNYESYDGFVVLHGTDTMAYSASALSFMLENLAKPVVFTGSQLPIGSLRTDAKENLISAVELAAARKDGKPTISEVVIYFESKLFRGNRTSKYNAEEFRAFQSYNYPPLAEIGVHIRYNSHLLRKPAKDSSFNVHCKLTSDVAILKIFPGISKKVVHAVLNIDGLKGLVLETYGAGNAPSNDWFVDELEKSLKKGLIILNVSQCAEGAVEMGLYETSIALEKAGVIGGKDITTEAAVTKLMYLLGASKTPDEIKIDLNRSIRGEISD